MASTADHIAARNDTDLRDRFVAAAEQLGISNNAQNWVEQNKGRLVAVDIAGTTVTDVHAYAVATYVPTPRPGENPAAVTDDHIRAAIEAVRAAENTANAVAPEPIPMPPPLPPL